jgi:hypothetical protein
LGLEGFLQQPIDPTQPMTSLSNSSFGYRQMMSDDWLFQGEWEHINE